MKKRKESKWQIFHESIYHPNCEERLRKAYELISSEIIAKDHPVMKNNNESGKVQKGDSIRTKKAQ